MWISGAMMLSAFVRLMAREPHHRSPPQFAPPLPSFPQVVVARPTVDVPRVELPPDVDWTPRAQQPQLAPTPAKVVPVKPTPKATSSAVTPRQLPPTR